MIRGMLSPMKMQMPLVSGLGSGRQTKAHSRAFPARRAIFAAGALLGLITLGGCGGGGGGGFANVPPVPFVYPTSLANATSSDTVDGFISPYALDPSTPKLVSTIPTVSGTSPSAGTITITVNAITLPDSSTEQAFSVKFDPADSTSTTVANSPLDGLSLSPQCANCLKTVTAYAIVGGTTTSTPVTFTYVDPASFSLTYSALGMWAKPTTNGSSNWPEIGGAFSAGVLTRGIDLPTTGSANYSGYFIGRYATSAPLSGSTPSPGTYIVGANASATANFGAGTVSFSTLNTNIALESGGGLVAPAAMPGLNLTSSPMPITRTSTSNSFTGTVSTSNGGLSGPIQGGFYGPPATTGDFAPPELGGSVSVTNNLDQSMVGSFALTK